MPELMQNPKANIDFEAEENRLLDEFKTISGVSDMMTKSVAQYTNMSGVALELLAEQDSTRLATAIDSTRLAIKTVAKYLLRLYKQYAVLPRLLKISGSGGSVEMHYWDQNEICSDDVVFDTSTDAMDSLAQRRTMLFDLINKGLMFDQDGKFSQTMRKKCLDLLGFGMWENTVDLTELQINHAREENIKLTKGEKITLLPIDDHKLHIDQHIAFILSGELKDKANKTQIEKQLLSHIEEHKRCLEEQKKNDLKGE